MKFFSERLMFFLLFSLVLSLSSPVIWAGEEGILNRDWEDIVAQARGSEVSFYMWGGDRRINHWVDTFVAGNLKEKYDIVLKRVPMGPDDYLNKLLTEKQLGSKKGSIDLLWINGENFKTARQYNLLFGPFASRLPNYHKYLDTSSPENTTDFGYPTEGYEVPFGRAQFVFIYDKDKVSETPQTIRELGEWIKNNPGRFTYPALPDFTGSAFVRLVIYELTGGYEQYYTITGEDLGARIKPALEFLNELEPYLWREGKAYPATIAQLDNMFADGEVWMTMSYHPSKASAEISKGSFADTVRTFVIKPGTISNTHFLAVPFNAPNKAGAMVVANYLIGFEAQLSKLNPEQWGDNPVFSYDKLSAEEQRALEAVDLGIATLPQKVLESHRVPEIPASLVPLIEEEWQQQVANK